MLLLYTEYRQVHIIYKHEHLYVQLTRVLHCKAKHHTILPEISKQFQQSSLWILDNRESANQLQKKKKNVSDVTNLQYQEYYRMFVQVFDGCIYEQEIKYPTTLMTGINTPRFPAVPEACNIQNKKPYNIQNKVQYNLINPILHVYFLHIILAK